MISLEQIRSLEERVHTAVTRIRTLAAENATLKQRLQSQEERIAELETLVAAFKRDQDEIEAGIMAALRHLDDLEDTMSEPDPDTADGMPDEPAREVAEHDEPQSEMPQPHEPQLEAGHSPESEPRAEASWETTDVETAGNETHPDVPDAPGPEMEIDDRYVPHATEAQLGEASGENPDTGEEPELDIF